MRAVLYTEDMEPITVIEVVGSALEVLKKCNVVSLPVHIPPKVDLWNGGNPEELTFIIVRVRAELFVRHGKECMILFTDNEVDALRLQCVFLAGQMEEVQRREAMASLGLRYG